MAAVERLVGMAERGERLGADAALQFVDAPRQHQHQGERQLGAGDIGAAAQGQHGDILGGAGRAIDAAQIDAVFLHRLEPRRRRKLIGADRKRLDDQRIGVGKIVAQRVLVFHHPHFGRIKLWHPLPQFDAPAVEIRLVMGEEIRISRAALVARLRIEHDLDHAQETIVFDDENRRHRLIPAHL